MASFGGYETVRQLHRSGTTVVSTARPAGHAGVDRFVVKSFEPSVLISGEEQVERQAQLFLQSAEAQQRVGASGAAHWAAVHQSGRPPQGGAFYVTDHLRRTARQLIDGRVKLGSQALYALVAGVIDGLIELRDACHRPHGNLKPANVMIAGDGSITSKSVRLADPLPADELEGRASEAADLQAIGALIYELVVHRPFRRMGGWPVPPSDEWSRLGGRAEAWRALCSRLLDPNLVPGLLTLEDLASDVAKVRGRARILSPCRLIAAVLVILALAGAFVAVHEPTRRQVAGFFRRPRPPVAAVPVDLFLQWCKWHYYALGLLCKDLGALEESGRLDEYLADAHLKKLVDAWRQAGKQNIELDPRELTAAPDLVRDAAIGNVDRESVRRNLDENDPGGERTRAAHGVFQRINESLKQFADSLEELQKRFEKRNWLAAARRLGEVTKPLKARVGQLVDPIHEGLQAKKTCSTIEQTWQKVEARLKPIQQASAVRRGDEVVARDWILEKFPEFARRYSVPGGDEDADRPLDKLDARIRELDELAAKLGGVVEPNAIWAAQVDREGFIKYSTVHQWPKDKPLEKSAYIDWIVEVQDPKYAFDPSINPFVVDAKSWDLKSIRERVEHLRGLEQHYPDKKSAQLQNELTTLDQRLEQGRKWHGSRSRLHEITAMAGTCRSALGALKSNVDVAIGFLQQAAEGDDVRAETRTLSDSIGRLVARHPEPGRAAYFRKGREDAIEPVRQIVDTQKLPWIRANEQYIKSFEPALGQASKRLDELRKRILEELPDNPIPELRQLVNELRQLIDELRGPPLTDPAGAARCAAELQAIENRPFWKLDWRDTSKQLQIREAAALAKGELEKLKARVEQRTTVVRDLRQPFETPSTVLAQAWPQRVGELLAKFADSAKLNTEGQQLRSFLQGLDDAFPAEPDLAEEPMDFPKASAATKFREEREAKLALAIRPENKQKVKALQDEFTNWHQDLRRLASDFKKIEDLLNGGYGLEEATQNGSIQQLYASWQQPDRKGVFDDFAAGLEGVTGRVGGLQAIKAAPRDQLIGYARAAGRPAQQVCAWRELGSREGLNWPGDIADLRSEAAIREGLASTIKLRIEDDARRDVLIKELKTEARRRWLLCFDALARASDRQPKRDLDDEDIAESINLMQRAFGLTAADLEPPVRFRIHLVSLRRSVARATEDEQVLKAVDELRKGFGSLPDPRVAEFIKSLQQIADKFKAGQQTGPDLSKAGPLSGLLKAAAWQREPGEQIERVRYTWADKRHTLEFRLVEPADADSRPFYLCTTEASLGLFVDVMTAGGLWDKMGSLLRDDPGRARLWEWIERGGPRSIAQAPQWLKPHPTWGLIDRPNPQYAEGLAKPPPPSWDHPMQFLSPHAALWCARLVGCRLPTRPEWQAALRAELAGRSVQGYVDELKPNLRDQTWARQRKHTTDAKAKGVRIPTFDYAYSGGEEGREGYDDGVVWFRTVGEAKGSTFAGLLGNVAEFLCDDAAGMEKFRSVGDLSVETIAAFFQAETTELYVTAGSAFSAPNLALDQPQQTDAVLAQGGFCDVGFRLAFTALGEPLVARVKRFLTRQGYLTAAAPPTGGDR